MKNVQTFKLTSNPRCSDKEPIKRPLPRRSDKEPIKKQTPNTKNEQN